MPQQHIVIHAKPGYQRAVGDVSEGLSSLPEEVVGLVQLQDGHVARARASEPLEDIREECGAVSVADIERGKLQTGWGGVKHGQASETQCPITQ